MGMENSGQTHFIQSSLGIPQTSENQHDWQVCLSVMDVLDEPRLR